jgi:dTDP-4-amino-4,6-dideoxygalactose transaminase
VVREDVEGRWQAVILVDLAGRSKDVDEGSKVVIREVVLDVSQACWAVYQDGMAVRPPFSNAGRQYKS